MYFTSPENEDIQQIIKTQIEGIGFEIPLTRAFFPHHDPANAKKHNHANYEVFFNERARGTMLVGNEEIAFCDNSMVIVAPHVYHAYKPNEAKGGQAVKYTLKFIDCDKPGGDGNFSPFTYLYVRNISHIFDTIARIHSAYGSKRFGERSEIESLFSVLLIEILREMRVGTSARSEPMAKDAIGDYKAVEAAKIEAFFERHYDTFPSPADLAKHLSVSTRQLDRVLKQLFKMSFSAKLALTKTELAKDLLSSGELSVAQISRRLGYLSPAGFSAAFKKQTGMPPSEIRRKRQGAMEEGTR